MIDDVPIVSVRKRVGKAIWIECPFCHQRHMHGAGTKPLGALHYGHRVAHCADRDLRRAQRHVPRHAQLTRNDLRGYILIDPRAAKMTEEQMQSLFEALDEIASNFARVTEPEDESVFWVDFKILLKRFGIKMPLEEQQALFAVWLDSHRGGRDARQAAMPQRMAALCEQARDLSLSCKYLPKRPRAKTEAQLAAVQNEIAALVTLPQYRGPLGTWPGAA